MASTSETETLPTSPLVFNDCSCYQPRQGSSSEMLDCCAARVLNAIPLLLSDIEEHIKKTLLDRVDTLTLYCNDIPRVLHFYEPPMPLATLVFRLLLVTHHAGHSGRPFQSYFSITLTCAIFPTLVSMLIISLMTYLCLLKSVLIHRQQNESRKGCCVERPTSYSETKINRIPEYREASVTTPHQTSYLPRLEQKTTTAQEPSGPNDVDETASAGQAAISWRSPQAQNGDQSLPGVSASVGPDTEKIVTDKIRGSGLHCNGQQTRCHRIPLGQKPRLTRAKRVPGHGDTHKMANPLSLSRFRETLSLVKLSSSLAHRNRRSHGEKLQGEQLKKKGADNSATADDESVILKELVSAPTMRFADGVRSHLFIAARGENVREERVRLASFDRTRNNIPRSGVWVTQLAAAGFYCSEARGSFVRCAFCDIRIELSRFVRRNPADVHRRESPDCPLVTGRADDVPFQQSGQESGLLWLKDLNAAVGAASDNKHSAFEQRQKQDDGKERPTLGDPADRKSETCPHPPPQPQSQPAASAFQNHSLTTLSSQAQPLVSSTSGSDSQSIGASASSASKTPSSSMSHTPVGQYPTGRGSSTSGFMSLPPSNTTASTSATSPALTPSRSAAGGAPLAVQVGTGVPRNAEPAPEIDGRGGTGSHNQRAAGQNVADSSRSVPLSRPVGPQRTASQLPYQSARFVDPAEHQQQERSSDASGRSGNGRGSSQSANTGRTNEPAPDPSTSRQLVTYLQLGIYTQEPKRPDLAISALRLNTYENPDHPWPHPTTHKPEDMAQAGFYYVGRGDTVRCFYCKGGLQGWADSPDPWVEHATHFPECPFVCQVKGQEFVDAVQALKGTRDTIITKDVEEELQRRQIQRPANVNQALLTQREEPVGGAEGGDLGAEGGANDADALTQLSERAEELETENKEMVDSRTCKICQVNEVSILFLPCGHLVSCAECSPALRTCAMCRQRVKGRVRVKERDLNDGT